MGLFDIDLNNINLDDTNYDEDYLETIMYMRLLTRHIKFQKCKAFMKDLSQELMLIA